MKETTAKKTDEVCPECGMNHDDRTAYAAEFKAIEADVQRIGEAVALLCHGEPSQAVTCALMTVALDALRREAATQFPSGTPEEQAVFLGTVIGEGMMFYEAAMQSAINEAIPTQCAPTAEKYPLISESTFKRARNAVTIEHRHKHDRTPNLHDIPEDRFRK